MLPTLLGTISVMSLVTGWANLFSAVSLMPVALVCWVRSKADLKHPTENYNSVEKLPRDRPVRTADALYPAVAGEYLGVPAVRGVVSHLVGHVLPEPQPAAVHSDLDEEVVDPGEEVAQGRVGHSATSHGLPYLDLPGRLAVHLVTGGVESHHSLRHSGELRVALVLGVTEVFYLRHGELSHSDQTRPGRDLVSKGVANLSSREWELALVELQQPLEVDEDSLRGLRPQEASDGSAGPDVGLEHQVEF